MCPSGPNPRLRDPLQDIVKTIFDSRENYVGTLYSRQPCLDKRYQYKQDLVCLDLNSAECVEALGQNRNPPARNASDLVPAAQLATRPRTGVRGSDSAPSNRDVVPMGTARFASTDARPQCGATCR